MRTPSAEGACRVSNGTIMTSRTQHSRLATNRLAARLVNPDGAGMVAARLDQENLFALCAWFESKTGGAQGLTLLNEAPVFDTRLEHLFLIAGGSDPACPGGGLTLFAAGLLAAADLRTAAEEGAPFEVTVDLDMLLGDLGASEAGGFLPVAEDREGVERIQDLAVRLLSLNSEIDLAVQAMWRVSLSRVATLDEGSSPLPLHRLLFFVGALAGGVLVPATAPSPCACNEGVDSSPCDSEEEA